jgi:anaerobic selenocysteine-containing dehydrogenase
MNENDIKKLGFENGDAVDIYNYHDDVERVAHNFMIIKYNIPEQCTATYFPETNVLVPINSVADRSNTPTSKNVVIKLVKNIK